MVLAEIGGRWSAETKSFVGQLAEARARSEPRVLKRRMEQVWRLRWCSILSCAAFAMSLLGLRGKIGADGHVLHEVECDHRFAGLDWTRQFRSTLSMSHLISREKNPRQCRSAQMGELHCHFRLSPVKWHRPIWVEYTFIQKRFHTDTFFFAHFNTLETKLTPELTPQPRLRTCSPQSHR